MIRRIAQLMELAKSALGKTMLFFLMVVCFFVFAPSVFANCSPPVGGNHTVTYNCAFSGSVNGADSGDIIVNSGVTLTVNANQTIVFNLGSKVTVNGTIAVSASGAQIKQTYLWMTDADSDNYPDSSTQYAQDSQPGGGRRRYLLASYSTFDCNSANGSVWWNGYGMDSDRDGVGASSSWGCNNGAYPRDATANFNDCNDADISHWWYGYADADGDGIGTGGALCNNGVGSNQDCNDADVNHWYTGYTDADGDGVGVNPSGVCNNGPQSNGNDCNDGYASYWYYGYEDADGDGVFGGNVVCNNGPGSPGSDCDDGNINAYDYGYGFDNDRDGFGVNNYGCNNGNTPYDGWQGWDPDDACDVVPVPYQQCQ